MEHGRGGGMKPRPEVVRVALCAECDAPFNAKRGLPEGVPYDHKRDGLLCPKCGSKPFVKTGKPPMLTNAEDIERELVSAQDKIKFLMESLAEMRTREATGK